MSSSEPGRPTDPSAVLLSEASENPAVIITIGMAGSGKTTFVQRLNSYLHASGSPPYIINLDLAVTHMPFEANIDIRDSVDYAQVMKQSVHLTAYQPAAPTPAQGIAEDPTAAL